MILYTSNIYIAHKKKDVQLYSIYKSIMLFSEKFSFKLLSENISLILLIF